MLVKRQMSHCDGCRRREGAPASVVRMGSTSLQLAAYLDALVHPTAQRDALTAAKHRGFIAAHLAGGACALAALPVFLALRGAPGIAEAIVFAWLVAPIGIAALLSRNGNFEAAHLLSTLTLAGLVATVGAITGGLSSFVLPWLLVMPLEAVFAGSRRTLACARGHGGRRRRRAVRCRRARRAAGPGAARGRRDRAAPRQLPRRHALCLRAGRRAPAMCAPPASASPACTRRAIICWRRT